MRNNNNIIMTVNSIVRYLLRARVTDNNVDHGPFSLWRPLNGSLFIIHIIYIIVWRFDYCSLVYLLY